MTLTNNVFEISNIVLPMPPSSIHEDVFAMEVYVRFMRGLRHVPTSRADVQVFTSIQFTAELMDIDDAQIAKILVDLGLRAPRSAFPSGYLNFLDRCNMHVMFKPVIEHSCSKDF